MTASSEPTKRCPFCAEEILAAAVRCKHCQADIPQISSQSGATSPVSGPAIRPGFLLGCGAVVLGLMGTAGVTAYALDSCSHSSPSSKPAHPNDDLVTAWVMAQQFVKKSLKSPGTADFGSVLKGDYQNPSDHVRALGPDRYEAHGWVDSQNAFGGLVRTRFRLTMQRETGGTWSVIDGPTFEEN